MIDTVAPSLQPCPPGLFLGTQNRPPQSSALSASSPQTLANALLLWALGTELGADNTFQGWSVVRRPGSQDFQIIKRGRQECHGLCMGTFIKKTAAVNHRDGVTLVCLDLCVARRLQTQTIMAEK